MALIPLDLEAFRKPLAVDDQSCAEARRRVVAGDASGRFSTWVFWDMPIVLKCVQTVDVAHVEGSEDCGLYYVEKR